MYATTTIGPNTASNTSVDDHEIARRLLKVYEIFDMFDRIVEPVRNPAELPQSTENKDTQS
jgi:hypothetical protein